MEEICRLRKQRAVLFSPTEALIVAPEICPSELKATDLMTPVTKQWDHASALLCKQAKEQLRSELNKMTLAAVCLEQKGGEKVGAGANTVEGVSREEVAQFIHDLFGDVDGWEEPPEPLDQQDSIQWVIESSRAKKLRVKFLVKLYVSKQSRSHALLGRVPEGGKGSMGPPRGGRKFLDAWRPSDQGSSDTEAPEQKEKRSPTDHQQRRR